MSNELPSRDSWHRAAKFRENLSQVTIVPANAVPAVEKSQFSPDSPPPGVPRASSSHNRMQSSSSTYFHKTTPRTLEAGYRHSDAERPRGVRDRIADFVQRLRNWRVEPEIVPIQQPRLAPWPPLHVEKRIQCHCEDPKHKKRRRLWSILLIIVLLYLLVNTLVLNVRLLGDSTKGQNGSTQSNGSSSSSSSLSASQQQCVTQFTVNAPSNPSSFPCSSCLPLLQAVPSSFATANAEDGQTIQNAIQFCGLKAIFDSANQNGQQTLASGNWAQDTKFCAWSGISCDGSGQVSTM